MAEIPFSYVQCAYTGCRAGRLADDNAYCVKHWSEVCDTVRHIERPKVGKEKGTDVLHYFFRCRNCHGLITRFQLQKALQTGAVLCPCGSGTVGPTNPAGLEWLKPSVFKMIVHQLLGKLDPAPEPTQPVPVPVSVHAVPALSDGELALGQDGEDVR